MPAPRNKARSMSREERPVAKPPSAGTGMLNRACSVLDAQSQHVKQTVESSNERWASDRRKCPLAMIREHRASRLVLGIHVSWTRAPQVDDGHVVGISPLPFWQSI